MKGSHTVAPPTTAAAGVEQATGNTHLVSYVADNSWGQRRSGRATGILHWGLCKASSACGGLPPCVLRCHSCRWLTQLVVEWQVSSSK